MPSPQHYTTDPTFDPYYTWLGIPPSEQPPNHYRLLGIPLFESNPDVIANAAERQIRYLRTFGNGPHSAVSQRILNEVATARVCLLDPGKKLAYDEAQRFPQGVRILPPSVSSPPLVVPAPPTDLLPATIAPIHSGVQSPPSHYRSRMRKRASRAKPNPARQVIAIVVGGIMGLAIGCFIIYHFLPEVFERRPSRPPLAKPSPSPSRPTPARPRTKSNRPVTSPRRSPTPPPEDVEESDPIASAPPEDEHQCPLRRSSP